MQICGWESQRKQLDVHIKEQWGTFVHAELKASVRHSYTNARDSMRCCVPMYNNYR